MATLLVIMYVLSSATVLVGAAAAVRRAVKHGATWEGMIVFSRDVLNPGKAWRDFALIAFGVILGTIADVISVLKA